MHFYIMYLGSILAGCGLVLTATGIGAPVGIFLKFLGAGISGAGAITAFSSSFQGNGQQLTSNSITILKNLEEDYNEISVVVMIVFVSN